MGLATMSGPIRSLGGVYITGPGAVVNVTASSFDPRPHASCWPSYPPKRGDYDYYSSRA